MGEAIIRLMTNPEMDCSTAMSPEISVSMRQMPNPAYTVDTFLIILINLLPVFVVLGYIYSAGVFTKVRVICIILYIHYTCNVCCLLRLWPPLKAIRTVSHFPVESTHVH